MSCFCQVCQSFFSVASCQDDLGQRIFVFMEKVIVWVADLGFRPWILGKPSGLVLLLLLVSLFYSMIFTGRKMAPRTKPGPRSAIFHDQTPAGKRGDGGGHRAGDSIFCGICEGGRF